MMQVVNRRADFKRDGGATMTRRDAGQILRKLIADRNGGGSVERIVVMTQREIQPHELRRALRAESAKQNRFREFKTAGAAVRIIRARLRQQPVMVGLAPSRITISSGAAHISGCGRFRSP